MGNYKMGICDKDFNYIVSLMEYINMHDQIPIRVSAFSSEKAVEEYMQEHTLDILLLGEDMQLSSENVFQLKITEQRAGQKNQEDIYKYQSMDKITAEILKRVKAIQSVKREQGGCFAVYSPLGRCGKTRFALGLCRYFGESLYINLEEYLSLKSEKYGDVAKVISKNDDLQRDFFYYLISRSVEIGEVVQSLPMVERKDGKGSFRIMTGSGYPDTHELRREDVEWLRDSLIERGKYRAIVFDIGTGALGDFSILEVMDKVYVPVLLDQNSDAKLTSFRELLEREEYREIKNKLQYIQVPQNAEYDSRLMEETVEREEF